MQAADALMHSGTTSAVSLRRGTMMAALWALAFAACSSDQPATTAPSDTSAPTATVSDDTAPADTAPSDATTPDATTPDTPPPDTQPADTPPLDTAPPDVTPGDDVIVVARTGPSDDLEFVLVTPDGTDVAVLDPPVADGLVFAVHQAPGSSVALVEGEGRLDTLDTTTLLIEPFLPDVRIEWRDADSRFMIVRLGQNLEVIDVPTLTRHALGEAEQFVSAARGGDGVLISAISVGILRTVLLDAATGATEILDDSAAASAFDDTGELLLSRRAVDDTQGTEYVVAPWSSPNEGSVWYRSDNAAQAAWGGDELVVVDGSRVLAVGRDATDEIATIPDESVRRLYGDPTSNGVLVAPGIADGTTWFHVDPHGLTARELPALTGLEWSTLFPPEPGLVFLDDRSQGPDAIGRAVVVRLRDGRVTELVTEPNGDPVTGWPLLPDHVAVLSLGDEPLRIVEIDTGRSIMIDDGVRAVSSPEGDMVAVVAGSARERITMILDLATGELGDPIDGQVIAWLDL